MTMRIGLIGWYGQGNAGDDRILHCLRRAFRDCDLLITTAWADATRRLGELNQCDLVIVGGGGLVLRGTGRHAALINAIKSPLCCLGISVESRHSDTEPLRAALAARCTLIAVRDAHSASAFPGRRDVIVVPDVTFLDPLPLVSSPQQDSCGLNLRPWRTWPGEHDGAFDRTMQRVQRAVPWLPCALPVPRWDPCRLVDALVARFGNVSPLPLSVGGGQDDRPELSRFFGAVPDQWDPSLLRRCRWVVGMRLHSVIFACQAGLPFVSIAYQPKCREFCRDLGYPQLSINPYGLRGLSDALAAVSRDYDQIRARLVTYRESARASLEPIVRDIRNCARI